MKQVRDDEAPDGGPAPGESAESGPGRKRVFLALPLSDDIRGAVADLSTRLQKAAHFTPLLANWVPPANFHLTLHFLGAVSVDRAARLLARLPEATRTARPFSVDVAGIGYFPHSGAPRVLWAGIPHPPKAMYLLRDALGRIVAEEGIELQHEEFHAHITLARFKSLKGTGAFVNVARSHQTRPVGTFVVETAHLMESLHDKERGVYYESLGGAMLGEG